MVKYYETRFEEYILVNNKKNLHPELNKIDTLQHDNQNHNAFPRSDGRPEPRRVGGTEGIPRKGA